MVFLLKGIHYLNKIISLMLVILTAVTVVVVFGQVFFRFILEEPLVWSEEVALYCFIWITFLGAALAVRNRSLIGVEAVVRKVPSSLRFPIEVMVQVLSSTFFLVMIIYGIETAILVAGQRAAATGISMAWVYAAVPVGGALMLINSMAWMIEYSKEAKSMG